MAWIGPAIAAGGSILGGMFGSSGAKKASKAQVQAMQQALALQQYMYNQGIVMNEPWRAGGQGALNNLLKFYGLPYQNYQAPQLLSSIGGMGGGGSGPSTASRWNNALLGSGVGFGLGGVGGSILGGIAGFGDKKRPPGQLSAKSVARMIRGGYSPEDIAKIGYLGPSGPKQYNRLQKAGLSADDIELIMKGPGGANELKVPETITPEGPDQSVFTQSPDYQFRRDEGMRDIGNSFAARGGAFSGNALRALTDFNQNMASSEFGNWFNRMASLAGIGQTATQSNVNAGQNFGNVAGNTLANIGNARASGIAGGANALGAGISGAGNALGYWWGNRNPYRTPPFFPSM